MRMQTLIRAIRCGQVVRGQKSAARSDIGLGTWGVELVGPIARDRNVLTDHTHNTLKRLLGDSMGDLHAKSAPKEVLHAHPLTVKIDPLRPSANGDDALQLPDPQKQHTSANDSRGC